MIDIEQLRRDAETILDRAPRPRKKKILKIEDKNPEILCGCGCGKKIRRFDEWGRTRRYVTGHNMRAQKTILDEIVEYLGEHGPTRRGDLAAALGLEARLIDKKLWTLRERGQIESRRYGVWQVRSGSTAPGKPRPAELVEAAEAAALWAIGKITDDEFRRAIEEAAK